MTWLREYMLQITACALLCAVVLTMFDKKDFTGGILRLICGIFMMICLIHPWLKLQVRELDDWLDSFQISADDIVADGEDAAIKAMSERIKQQTEAYILDKAASLNVHLQVEVELGVENGLPMPRKARILGNISPYAKKKMQEYIEKDLGISLEDQTWIT